MLKIIGLVNKLVSSKSNSSRPASSRNNSSKLVFEENNGNNKVDKFSSNCIEYAKQSKKSKAENCLSQKII